MREITASPLCWPQGWPRSQARSRAKFSKGERKYSSFNNGETSSSWISRKELSVSDATKRVLLELGRLGVADGDAIISTNLQLRIDGLPRSNQGEPANPGVAVYWETGKGTKVMAIDRYDRVADNLAAIAATLEAMRAIERHGGGQILERAFTGFTALAAPKSCWEILGLRQGAPAAEVNARFRDLANQHHPDKPGGDHGRMAGIAAARDEALRL